MSPGPSTATRRSAATPPFLRHAFLALLALWVVMPIGLHGRVAQDAVPFITAGHLAHAHPAEVYAARHGDLFDLRPAFRREWCTVAPSGTDCDNLAVAFVASPPLIPVVVVLARLGDDAALLIMQFGASLMLAGGMWVLWERLARRTRHAPQLLLASTLLLTPMAMVPIGLGQTSPIMFLSVCAGLGAPGTRRRIGSIAAWTAAVVIKVIPAALVALVIWRKRWTTLGWAAATIAALSLVSLAIVTPATWGDFVHTTLQLSSTTTTNPYNGSFSALLTRVLPGDPTVGTGAAVVKALSVLAGVLICWFGMRGTDDDTRWAVGFVALLFFTPLVWWHYVWVAIGALGVVLAQQRRLDDRMLALLPVTALVSVVPSFPNANGHSLPVVQALFLIAMAVIICLLADRIRRTGQGATARPPTVAPD
jgi:hypothetical protein